MEATALLWVLFLCGIHTTTGTATIAYGPVGLSRPTGVVVDSVSDSLFIVDNNNSRVLRFANRNLLTPTRIPDCIFGQIGTMQQASAFGFAFPTAACVDANGTLFVSDTGNNRIMVFPQASSAFSGAAASEVLGQVNFTFAVANQGLSNPNPTTLNQPRGLSCSSDDLWVADSANNRVLRFPISVANDGPAASVLGQLALDMGAQHIPPASTSVSIPVGVLASEEGVFVADTANNRVLYFPATVANSSGAAATVVYGQSNFVTGFPLLSLVGMANPIGLAMGLDGILFVADENNNRILIFSPLLQILSFPIIPIGVFGQPSFFSSTPGNGTNQLNGPQQIAYDAKYNCLYVADTGNNRVVRYQLAPSVNNISSLDVQVTFPSSAPKVILSPKGQTNSAVTIAPISLIERQSNGGIVQSLSLPQAGFAVSSSIDSQQNQGWRFINTFPPQLQELEVDYQLFAVQSTQSSAGISFNSFPGTLKLSLTLSNWNFSSPSNTLFITLTMNIQPPFTNISQSTSGNITTFLLSSNTLNTTINMLHLGISDNTSIVPISISLNTTSSSSSSSNGENSTIVLTLGLSSFNSSFHYDPDFSITFLGGGDGGSFGGGDGGGNSNLLALLSLLVLLVVPSFFIFVGLMVFSYVYFIRRKQRQTVAGMMESQSL